MKIWWFILIISVSIHVPGYAETEIDRLKKVIAKKDYEIQQLRKEVDLLHQQLAEEQPWRSPSREVLSDIDKMPRRAQVVSNTSANKSKSSSKAAYQGPTKPHTVVKGDTLGRLASIYNTTVADIQSANQLSGHIIRLGEILKIPDTAPADQAISADNQSKAQVNKQSSSADKNELDEKKQSPAPLSHVVKAGDTYFSLAQAYSVPVDRLKSLNPNLKASQLQIGQKVIIHPPAGGNSPRALSQKNDKTGNTNQTSLDAQAVSQPVTASSSSNASPKVELVVLDREMTFEEFAREQGVSMESLNQLNGHSLKADELLARESKFLIKRR